MKKLFGKIIGTNETVPPTTPKADLALVPRPIPTGLSQTAPPPGKINELIGTHPGYVIYAYFPDYPELAALLSEEANKSFLKDFANVATKALGKLLALVNLTKDGVLTVAILDSPKQSPQIVTEVISELDKYLLIWVGTFGRIGIPTLKYKMGVGRGEMTVQEAAPEIQGPAFEQAREIAQTICVEFEVRVAASGDLIRASTDSVNWIDIDDWKFSSPASQQAKPLRVFSKLTDRMDADDLQLLRGARKAYFHQNWQEAAEKFDRISQLPGIRGITQKYIKRIKDLKKRPKDPDWDGVYRRESD